MPEPVEFDSQDGESWLIPVETDDSGTDDNDDVFEFRLPPGTDVASLDSIRHFADSIDPAIEIDVSTGSGPAESWNNKVLKQRVTTAASVVQSLIEQSPTRVCLAELQELEAATTLLLAIGQMLDRDSETKREIGMSLDSPIGATSWMDAVDKLNADCEAMLFTPIRRRKDGTFSLRWGRLDRDVLTRAVDELQGSITSGDPNISRLFPPAYPLDEELNEGWEALAQRELVDIRFESLEVVRKLLDAQRCTEDELSTLMRVMNDARLMLAASLNVDEDGPSRKLARAHPQRYFDLEYCTHLVGVVLRVLGDPT